MFGGNQVLEQSAFTPRRKQKMPEVVEKRMNDVPNDQVDQTMTNLRAEGAKNVRKEKENGTWAIIYEIEC